MQQASLPTPAPAPASSLDLAALVAELADRAAACSACYAAFAWRAADAGAAAVDRLCADVGDLVEQHVGNDGCFKVVRILPRTGLAEEKNREEYVKEVVEKIQVRIEQEIKFGVKFGIGHSKIIAKVSAANKFPWARFFNFGYTRDDLDFFLNFSFDDLTISSFPEIRQDLYKMITKTVGCLSVNDIRANLHEIHRQHPSISDEDMTTLAYAVYGVDRPTLPPTTPPPTVQPPPTTPPTTTPPAPVAPASDDQPPAEPQPASPEIVSESEPHAANPAKPGESPPQPAADQAEPRPATQASPIAIVAEAPQIVVPEDSLQAEEGRLPPKEQKSSKKPARNWMQWDLSKKIGTLKHYPRKDARSRELEKTRYSNGPKKDVKRSCPYCLIEFEESCTLNDIRRHLSGCLNEQFTNDQENSGQTALDIHKNRSSELAIIKEIRFSSSRNSADSKKIDSEKRREPVKTGNSVNLQTLMKIPIKRKTGENRQSQTMGPRSTAPQ